MLYSLNSDAHCEGVVLVVGFVLVTRCLQKVAGSYLSVADFSFEVLGFSLYCPKALEIPNTV